MSYETFRICLYIAIGLVVISQLRVANKYRNELGYFEHPSYDAFMNRLFGNNPHPGLLPKLDATLAYPLWRFLYAILGTPIIPDNLAVVAADTPPPTVDIPELTKLLWFELGVEVPDATPALLDAIAIAACSMMQKDLTEPDLTSSERPRATRTAEELIGELRVPIDPNDIREAWVNRMLRTRQVSPLKILREAFVPFLRGFPTIIAASSSGLTTALKYLTTSDKLGKLFYAIIQKDLFERTYAGYITSYRVANRMADGGNYAKDSAPFIEYVLSDWKPLADTPLPIALPDKSRFEGMWIIAPQGQGKTTLLSALLKPDLHEVLDGKATIILFDSKGDLIDHMRQFKAFAPGGELAGKLTLIEPAARLAINPLDLGASAGHAIELLEYVFSALLETKTTPLQATLFRSVLIAMKAIPEANFTTFRQFLQDGWQPFEEYVRTLDPDDADFFLKGEFDSKTYRGTRDELLWRIRDLTTRVPLLRDMFRAPTTKIDMGKLMDTPGVVIIDNSVAALSQGGSEFFGRFFIALILAAAQQRAGRQQATKNPVYVYLDEAQTIIAKDENIATIIQTCRSQNIAMTFAHQELSQITSESVRGALGNCAIRFANPDKDAKALADDLRTEPETLQAIPKGNFALFIRDYTKNPLIVSVPNTPVSSWPKMTADELAKIRETMRIRYSFSVQAQVVYKEKPVDGGDTSPKQWG